jgi:aspartate racemase
MKTIGLIGGTGWVSTMAYYRLINQLTNELLGGNHFPRLLLFSLNFNDFKKLADADDREGLARLYTDAARKLEAAGADCIVICANTPHIIADKVQKQISVPLINVAKETGKAVAKEKIHEAGLLGTKFVMEQPFFREELAKHGIAAIIPEAAEREFIHTSIMEELARGVFSDITKSKYIAVIDRLITRGAQGMIYACTELSILIKPEESRIITFDTTSIHAKAAVRFAAGGDYSLE